MLMTLNYTDLTNKYFDGKTMTEEELTALVFSSELDDNKDIKTLRIILDVSPDYIKFNQPNVRTILNRALNNFNQIKAVGRAKLLAAYMKDSLLLNWDEDLEDKKRRNLQTSKFEIINQYVKLYPENAQELKVLDEMASKIAFELVKID